MNPLTSSQADTPANHSPSQADEQAPTTRDTYGPTSGTPFATYDPDSHCWKTLQLTLDSDSVTYSAIWPRSGMTLDGIAYLLPPSAPRTSATAYSLSQHGQTGPNSDGLRPTATTGEHYTRFAQGGMPLGMAARLWPTPTAWLGRRESQSLGDPKRWANPERSRELSDAVAYVEERRLWPTPTARDHKDGLSPVIRNGKIQTDTLGRLTGGRLNPQWVEWLMGFPTGWTDCEDSETPSSPK